jgi:subtilase-type serine protease
MRRGPFDERLASPQGLAVTPLNVPPSQFPTATTTILTGIRGNLITATVFVTGGTVGAVYDRKAQTWTKLTIPGASSTAAYGPDPLASGYRIVGSFTPSSQTGDVGFIYDSSTKRVIKVSAKALLRPSKNYNYTVIHSIKGNNAVGNYNYFKTPPSGLPSSANSFHAFIYNIPSKQFITIDLPNAKSTTAYGIWQDGSVIAIAGGYTDSSGNHAYVRSLNWASKLVYNYPGAVTTHFEGITGTGKAGNYNVVGDYSDVKSPSGPVHGFFLPITNWKAGTPVIIGRVSVNSVYNRTAVGLYQRGTELSGYYVNIPVPDPP